MIKKLNRFYLDKIYHILFKLSFRERLEKKDIFILFYKLVGFQRKCFINCWKIFQFMV